MLRLMSAAKRVGAGNWLPPTPAVPIGGMRTFTDSKWAFLLGPQTVPGTYVATGIAAMESSLTARVNEFVTLNTSLPGFVAGSGTITVTNGLSTVAGVGTNFLSRVGTTMRWPDATTPKGYGYGVVCTASSNTACTIGAYSSGSGTNQATNYSGTSVSGVVVAYPNPAQDSSGNVPADFHGTYNYYDTVLAIYQAWAKVDNQAAGSSLLTSARTIADALADTRVLGGLLMPNIGINATPRQAALVGLACRAYDGGFNAWFDTMDRFCIDQDYWLSREKVGGSTASLPYVYSVRDEGYMLMFNAILGVMHPNVTRRDFFRDRAIAYALDPFIRKFDVAAVGGLRWFNRPENNAITEADGTTWANFHQPFLHAIAHEAMIWVHRMMRWHGMTATQAYVDIGAAIVSAANGWWATYQGSHNGQPATSRAVAYYSGLSGQKLFGVTPLTTVTPPGAPVALALMGTTWDNIVEGRQLNADGMANLAYAYAVSGDSAHRDRCLEAVASCFEAQAAQPSTYSSLWYVGQTEKNWNQHHRQCQKLTGWLHAGLDTF
jgi:hypothetical protein